MKRFMLLSIILGLAVIIMAAQAPDFLIGTFSQYQLRYAGNDYDQNFMDLAQYLHNTGFTILSDPG